MARGIRNEKIKRVTGWASEKKELQDIIKPLERGGIMPLSLLLF